MSDGFQYGDIIFLGLMAAFVALRLRSMLGKGGSLDPRDVWKQATRDLEQEKEPTNPERAARKPSAGEDVVPVSLQENPAVVAGLKAIRAADANFSAMEFLSGAKLA